MIIPVYNSGSSAVLAIESVLSQTHQCTEIIVVDDGSTDQSLDLIRNHFQDQSKRLKIKSIENRGAAGARNFGLAMATSDWVAFLDSDDTWFPCKLEAQFSELERDATISLIGTWTNMRGFHIGPLVPLERLTVIHLRTLLFKNYFQTSTVVVRRAVIEELGGFPEGRRYAEEGDLFMRIAARCKCVLINEVMVDYAGGKFGFGASGISGLSANLWGMERGELRNIYGAWARRDSGLFLTGGALVFSLIKFARRVAIRLGRQLFRGA